MGTQTVKLIKGMHKSLHASWFVFIVCGLLLFADGVAWYRIASYMYHTHARQEVFPRISFLTVSSGDATLITFQHNVHILIDAGASGSDILPALASVWGSGPRSITLAIIALPTSIEAGGFSGVLQRYHIGAFVYAGRDGPFRDAGWASLYTTILRDHIPLLTVGQGDLIAYRKDVITILSPSLSFAESASLNETGLAIELSSPSLTALLVNEGIDGIVQQAIVDQLALKKLSFRVDLLGYSWQHKEDALSAHFLHTINPSVVVMAPGSMRANAPGATFLRTTLTSSTAARQLRTDHDGTVTIWREDNTLIVHNSGIMGS